MNKISLKSFIEYKYNKKSVIIDDFCVGKAGWEVQIVWRESTEKYMGDNQMVSLLETEEFFDWKKLDIRKQKIKRVCSKLGM